MKIRGYLKGKGKLGNIVLSTVAGETIARDYNPEVANPNTTAQVEQRAKFKLMSQLGSVVAPVIAIPKDGMKSKRNLFVKENFGLTSFAGDTASVNLNQIQLTKSNKSFAGIEVTRGAGDAITAKLQADSSASVSKVVYIMLAKQADGSLMLVGQAVASEAGQDGKFAASLPATAGEIVVYGYTLTESTAKATATFANLKALTAETVAKVIANRELSAGDLSTSKTAGCTMGENESEAESEWVIS